MSAEQLSKSLQFVAIGDSITYGFPYRPIESWLQVAGKELSFTYVNQGVNGDTTDGMASRFTRDVLRLKPERVIIMGGTNDIYNGSEVDQLCDNIIYMVEAALKEDIIPILGLPIPCNDEGEERQLCEYRKRIMQYASQQKLDLINFYQAMADELGGLRSEFDYDGIHPNKKGYKKMADVAVAFLKKL